MPACGRRRSGTPDARSSHHNQPANPAGGRRDRTAASRLPSPRTGDAPASLLGRPRKQYRPAGIAGDGNDVPVAQPYRPTIDGPWSIRRRPSAPAPLPHTTLTVDSLMWPGHLARTAVGRTLGPREHELQRDCSGFLAASFSAAAIKSLAAAPVLAIAMRRSNARSYVATSCRCVNASSAVYVATVTSRLS